MTNICIIGVGGMGKKHAKILSSFKNVKLYLVDPCFENHDCISEFSGENLYSEISQIDFVNIDGCIIATPVDKRYELLSSINVKEMPILFEKPFTLGLQNYLDLTSKINSDLCFVGYPRRYSTGVNIMREYIRKHPTEVQLIETNFAQDFAKYRPDFHKTYYKSYSSGGGFKMDGLNHHIDLIKYVSRCENYVKLNETKLNLFLATQNVDDYCMLQLQLDTKKIATLRGNQFQKPNDDTIKIITENYSIEYDRLIDQVSLKTCDTEVHALYSGKETWSDLLIEQIKSFMLLVTERKQDPRNCKIEDLAVMYQEIYK